MKESLRILLDGLVDYAGLFPPAQLPVERAVRNYAAYHGEDAAWMLGSFILPVARLAEFEDAVMKLPDATETYGWRLSAIASPQSGASLEAFTADIARINDFNRRHRSSVQDAHGSEVLARFVIDGIEVKVDSGEEVRGLAAVLGRSDELACYCEVGLNEEMIECLDAISEAALRNKTSLLAKVRTGGLDASGFPTNELLLRFIAACYERGISFKATAGLHHPLRGTHTFTYEEDSQRGVMHGFLNVFIAAAFICHGMRRDEAIGILDATSLDDFRFDENAVAWRTHHLDKEQLRNARLLATSFGSCSFTEPLQDLKALNLL